MFKDIREYIKKAREMGEYRLFEGADWDLEIGIITELLLKSQTSPLLLFDKIKGYPAGYRVASNLFSTHNRVAAVLDIPQHLTGKELVMAWREKVKAGVIALPPIKVKQGEVMENMQQDGQVDLLKFPVPKWHELDGGRYLGTGHVVITRHPEEGWVNLGTYRLQVHEPSVATIHMSPGRHCEMIAKNYWKKGKNCPIAVTCGQDPAIYAASTSSLGWGSSEYNYAGWLRGEPVQVIDGPVTGLPISATAEIALEGELLPPEKELMQEGPFGEWTGHYGIGKWGGRDLVFKVKSVMHRDEPIITGNPPLLGEEGGVGGNLRKAAIVWDELDKQVPGIKGVWCPAQAGTCSMVIISLEQQYPGHAKQAALAVAASKAAAYMLKIVMVVDEDIDPSNIDEVLWALGMRCDAQNSIDVIRDWWGSQTDPFLAPEKRARMDYSHSLAIISACKPYYWIKEFPPTIRTTPELLEKIKGKWNL